MKKFNIRIFLPENDVYELVIDNNSNGKRDTMTLYFSKEELKNLRNLLIVFLKSIQ